MGRSVRAHARWSIAVALALSSFRARGQAPPLAAANTQSAAVLELQRDVDTIIGARDFESTFWGISIRSLAADDTLYSLNAVKLMMPASTLKVVTLAAAAERLGWDFSYETRVVADGSISGDTLDGNLVIIASGDPSLDRRTLEAWVAQLKALGIAKITGTVLVDARLFSGEGLGFGWSWDDLAYYYAAPIAAGQFRENAVDLTLRPAASVGAPPAFELAPSGISGLVIENRMTTGPAAAAAVFVARRSPKSSLVVIEGIVPLGAKPVSHGLSVEDPVRFLAAALTDALLAGGVTVGRPPLPVASAERTRDFSAARLLMTHRSAPLRVLARRLMEVSQNQYAETLVKTMGAQAGDATFEGGLKAQEAVLAAWGLPAGITALRDGSGLSRYDYAAPDALAQVLAHAFRDPVHREPLLSVLNVAGQTGTLAGRLKNTAAAGNARGKDGSMAGVRAFCGVVNSADREPLVFAILANNFTIPGTTVTAAIDAIVARLAEFKR